MHPSTRNHDSRSLNKCTPPSSSIHRTATHHTHTHLLQSLPRTIVNGLTAYNCCQRLCVKTCPDPEGPSPNSVKIISGEAGARVAERFLLSLPERFATAVRKLYGPTGCTATRARAKKTNVALMNLAPSAGRATQQKHAFTCPPNLQTRVDEQHYPPP